MYFYDHHLSVHQLRQIHVVPTHVKVMTKKTKTQASSIGRGIVPTKPTFLDIVPLDEKTITSPSLSPGHSLAEVVRDDSVGNTIGNDT